MEVNLDLGRNGNCIFKKSVVNEIQRTLESSYLTLDSDEEGDDSSLDIRNLRKSFLQKWVVDALQPNEKRVFIKKVACEFTYGKFLVHVFFSNCFQATFVNIHVNKELSDEGLRKKELKAIKAKFEQREIKPPLLKDKKKAKVHIHVPPPSFEKLKNCAREKFLEVGVASLKHGTTPKDEFKRLSQKKIQPFSSSSTSEFFREMIFSYTSDESKKVEPNKRDLLTAKPTFVKLGLTLTQMTILENGTNCPGYHSNPYQLSDKIDRLKCWLNDANHDQAVSFLSHSNTNNLLPPLELMSIIMKKFGGVRLGTIEFADAIFERVQKVYLNSKQCSNEEVNIFVGNYMLIYILRQKESYLDRDVETLVKSLFHSFPSVYTLNMLIRMYLDFERNDEAGALFNQYFDHDCSDETSKWPYEKNSYRLRLQYLYQKFGFNPAFSYFQQIFSKKQFSSMCFYMIQIIQRITDQERKQVECKDLKRNEVERVQYFFDHYLSDEMRKKPRFLQELMFSYAKHWRLGEVWRIFFQMEKPTRLAFQIIIDLLFDESMNHLAIRLLKYAQKCGFFREALPTYGNLITVNLHSFDHPNKNGLLEYTTYTKQLIGTILQQFYLELFSKYPTLTLPVPINFICGKGKGKTVNIVLDLLYQQFGWKAEVDVQNTGQLLFLFGIDSIFEMQQIVDRLMMVRPNHLSLQKKIHSYLNVHNEEKVVIDESWDFSGLLDSKAVNPPFSNLSKDCFGVSGVDSWETLAFMSGLTIQKTLDKAYSFYQSVGICTGLEQRQLKQLVFDYIKTNKKECSLIIQSNNNQNILSRGTLRFHKKISESEITILMKALKRPIYIIGSKGILENKAQIEDLNLPGEPIFVSSDENRHFDAYLLNNTIPANQIASELSNCVNE